MENKKSYTHEEIEEILSAYIEYKSKSFECYLAIGKENTLKAKKELNKSVKNCEEHIPKSLIDKFKIKKLNRR
jgi:hypothetical protein